ncbi:MAG: hypothetical protein RR276_05275 [Angelakisella sp.]
MSTTKSKPKQTQSVAPSDPQGSATAGVPTAQAVKQTSLAAAKAIYLRRRIIVCLFAIGVVAFFIWFLTQFIPRSLPEPEFYSIGELKIQSLTHVVGNRKVLGISESLSGLGRPASGVYTYQAGESPEEDIQTYCTLLQQEYGAQPAEDSPEGEGNGKRFLTIPTGNEQSHVVISLVYDSKQYVVTLEEQLIPKAPDPPAIKPRTLTAEEAYNKLMSLTKDETGFKADISVYGYLIDPEPVLLDGWEYYVITIQAEYSPTNIEYRGTFYVGCFDGVILRYDLETATASRVRPEEPAAKPKETPVAG